MSKWICTLLWGWGMFAGVGMCSGIFWIASPEVAVGGDATKNVVAGSGEAAGTKADSVTPEKDPAAEVDVPWLEKVRGAHPRLLFSKDDLASMKAWAKTDEGALAMKKIEEYLASSNAGNASDFQRNPTVGQREGMWRAPTVGMHYLLTGDKKSKEKALGYMKLFLETDNWELGGEKDSGMSSANISIGAALLYDWLYNDLDPAFRAKYRDKLLTMARRQYYGGHLNRNGYMAYWQGDTANNHRWHRDAGFSLCVLSAAEEGNVDDRWILSKLKEELDYVHE